MLAPSVRVWRFAELAAWGVGAVCVAAWIVVSIDSATGKRREMDRFAAVRATTVLRASDGPDLHLWSRERIAAWRETTKTPSPAPLAILRIPRIGLEVPVIEGTDDISLNRGAGHIEDTATPGTDGNSGIAGHRDGFFRGLKDVATGDAIQIETLNAIETYRIERTWIVDPDEVSVLDPTPVRSVTLVTCYPFYFVGSAPQRYIVRAVLQESTSTSANP
jgi:sortase A